MTQQNVPVDPPAEQTTPQTTAVTDPLPAGVDPATTEAAGTQSPAFVQPIVAEPDKKFFVKRMVIAAVVLGFGAFFLYDGFVRYPAHNARVNALDARIAEAERKRLPEVEMSKARAEKKELGGVHSDWDMTLQKIIGFALLPLGLYLLTRFLRESRGQLRLDHDIVHVPGHPPVPIRSITNVHNAKWDKKGIAKFDYKLADGTTGQFKIDDFVFFRPPTDAIHDEIIAKMPRAAEV